MAYDVFDQYLLMYGLYTGSAYLNGTWAFSGGTWTELHPTQSPPTGGTSQMVYDAKDGFVLWQSDIGGGQTWKFHGGQWSNLTSVVGAEPPIVGEASIGYDVVDGEVILYGIDYVHYALNQTWAFAGDRWTNLSVDGGPAAEGNDLLAWDDSAEALVLESPGVDGDWSDGSYFRGACNATWTFAHNRWSPSPTPGLCTTSGASMAYDSADGEMVLFNGGSGSCSGQSCNSTWLMDSTGWVGTNPQPSPRRSNPAFATIAYDAADGEIVLFGGVPANPTGPYSTDETWTYAHGVWTEIFPPSPPEAPPSLWLPALGTGVAAAVVVIAAVLVRRRRRNGPP